MIDRQGPKGAQSASHEVELKKLDAELKRSEAERRKLDLEAAEIEQRLKSKWWHSDKFSQYVFASIVSAAVLFAWAKTYYEPIAFKKDEINKLENERLVSLQKKIEVEERELKVRNDDLATENDRLSTLQKKLESQEKALQALNTNLVKERDGLKTERNSLYVYRDNLKLVVDGFKIALDQQQEGQKAYPLNSKDLIEGFKIAAENQQKVFSFLNNKDPLFDLTSYGWSVGSDNYWGFGK